MTNEERIESPFGEPVCDFCLVTRPRWSYDPRDISLGASMIELPHREEGQAIYLPSASAWAACTRCATIIDRGDAATLARVSARSAQSRLSHVGVPPAPDLEAEVARLIIVFRELLPGFQPRRHASTKERNAKHPSATIAPGRLQTPNLN
jgi:hypothetical protein